MKNLFSVVTRSKILCIFCLLITSRVNCQFDLAPDIPSHLPSPPKPSPSNSGSSGSGGGGRPANSGGGGGAGSNGQVGGFLQGSPPLPPPQNIPPGPLGPGGLPGDFVPFGLNHIILIIVPQFKTKYRKLPEWIASSVKVSMPITIFFDQLHVPPGMFIPGPGGLPPLPLGVPPPMRPPGSRPSLASPMTPDMIGTPGSNDQMNFGYGYYPQKPYLYGQEGYDGDPEVDDVEGYDNDNYYSVEERSFGQRRRKREANFANQTAHIYYDASEVHEYRGKVKKRAVSFNHTAHKSERASIIPKLEKILNSAGLDGKPCLLRAVCEIHEAPLSHYGLMGEILTMFFSISRSIFAESHLGEYVLAEEAGRNGDCTQFYRQCENTMFSWEEKYSKKKKRIPIYGTTNELN